MPEQISERDGLAKPPFIYKNGICLGYMNYRRDRKEYLIFSSVPKFDDCSKWISSDICLGESASHRLSVYKH